MSQNVAFSLGKFPLFWADFIKISTVSTEITGFTDFWDIGYWDRFSQGSGGVCVLVD